MHNTSCFCTHLKFTDSILEPSYYKLAYKKCIKSDGL